MSSTMLGSVAVLILAGVGALVLLEARRRRRDAIVIGLLSSLGPAAAEGRQDPERLVAWAEVASTARALFPDAFARLDDAAGGRFPFSREVTDAAHARWTADWLAWERQHDLEYKRRATAAEASCDDDAGAVRAELAAITQEKLQTYQERYEHYVRVGKAIAALDEMSHRDREK